MGIKASKMGFFYPIAHFLVKAAEASAMPGTGDKGLGLL